MNQTKNILKVSTITSILLDLISMGLWIGIVARQRQDLFIWLVVVTFIHAILLFAIHSLLKYCKLPSFLTKQQKTILMFVGILTFGLVVFSFITNGNAIALLLMLFNGMLFLMVPHRSSYEHYFTDPN
ncbi:hypothetical protein [Streptococcus merionis]|uniref:hypothetical protein n=1 Tax=Streptococcus merionis TaxID=400065 RepID=UPI0035174B26